MHLYTNAYRYLTNGIQIKLMESLLITFSTFQGSIKDCKLVEVLFEITCPKGHFTREIEDPRPFAFSLVGNVVTIQVHFTLILKS